ncbi:hypothetical protein Tc00.1047053507519.167 [Trypanosoma cruzi]|uniref:Actin-like protein n=1 Tax=Trypanosoma cruzi (strain CL Brener) TaxID=353153 RepID=Q4DNY9_TRYCC|nr:hypothetical protein Tc00.1047053507519.167 [Trypanosoma cruzi]EAN94258.1 hypothetical protein Tc00.1047053507519.167 [Trypanosoma cruzi]|eukprot:XP_816109.1 hypothetical protein [Trypanosoma cruzi strain CL Brener]
MCFFFFEYTMQKRGFNLKGMTTVAFDIGSCFTKVYFGGDTPGRRVFKTPLGLRKLKERFDITLESAVLDYFLRRLCSAVGLLESCKRIEVLVSPGDYSLFTQYVLRWLASASLSRLPIVVDGPSWLLKAHGMTDGCVVDIGYQATRVVPILSSIPVVEAITIGSGTREFLALSAEGWLTSSEAISPSSSSSQLQGLLIEMSQCIFVLLEEAVAHCNAHTQRPFVSAVFLLTGGGVAVEGLVKGIQSSVLKMWPNSHLFFAETASPALWSLSLNS